MSLVVNLDAISQKFGSQLKDIDLSPQSKVLKKVKEVDIGFVASKSIEKLMKKDIVSQSDVVKFKEIVQKYVIATVHKILEKSPIGSIVVRNALVFDPTTIICVTDTSDMDILIKKMKALLSHMIHLKVYEESFSDKVLNQYRDFLDNELKINLQKFKDFKKEDTLIVDFFFSIIQIDKKYTELSDMVKIILTLSHGQAAVERSFSLGKPLIHDNIKSLSLINKKLIRDHMLSNNVTPESISISKKWRHSIKVQE